MTHALGGDPRPGQNRVGPASSAASAAPDESFESRGCIDHPKTRMLIGLNFRSCFLPRALRRRYGSIERAVVPPRSDRSHSDPNGSLTTLASLLLAMHIPIEMLEKLIGAHSQTFVESGPRAYGKARVLRERFEPTGPRRLGWPLCSRVRSIPKRPRRCRKFRARELARKDSIRSVDDSGYRSRRNEPRRRGSAGPPGLECAIDTARQASSDPPALESTAGGSPTGDPNTRGRRTRASERVTRHPTSR